MRPLGVILALGMLAGCSTIGEKPVEGWPELAIVEHHVSDEVMREQCAPFARYGRRMLACARFHFEESRCEIWYGSLWLMRPIVVAHERAHCRGYDHAGDGDMARMLKNRRAAVGG